jgi:hypothetical protein
MVVKHNLPNSMADEPEVLGGAIIPPGELDLEELDGTEDAEALKAKAEKATTFARQAIARAKKAEQENKELKTPKAPTATPQPSSQPSVEETVLLAQGLPEELLGELKVVAQMRGISLIKAQADSIFVAVKEKFEKDQKQKSADLPASRGSGAAKPKVTAATPGLPREEHMRLAKEALE